MSLVNRCKVNCIDSIPLDHPLSLFLILSQTSVLLLLFVLFCFVLLFVFSFGFFVVLCFIVFFDVVVWGFLLCLIGFVVCLFVFDLVL